MKKVYSTPELTMHGNIEEITLVGGTVAPKDAPRGQPNSAFS